MPARSVIAGLTAAALHGLWLPEASRTTDRCHRGANDGRSRVPSRAADSASASTRRPATRDVLRADEIVHACDGLPVTTETRTWIDLAEVTRDADLVAVRGQRARGAPRPLTSTS